MIVWHNPRCGKSRDSLKALDERNISYTIIEYLKDTPSKDELKDVISKLGITDIREMMRNKETEYKELDLKNQAKTVDELIDAMIQYPKLIERPLAINGNKAAIGRPVENILNII